MLDPASTKNTEKLYTSDIQPQTLNTVGYTPLEPPNPRAAPATQKKHRQTETGRQTDRDGQSRKTDLG